MGAGVEPSTTFEFSAGELCLDFANTIGDHARPDSEKLRKPSDFLLWAREAGILARHAARPVERGATPAALGRVVRFREALFRTFSALAREGRPADDDLEELNRVLGAALRHLRLTAGEGGFDWTWSEPPSRLEHLLWPVARSAADLLTSAEALSVRECASDRCTWLFVDRSRTHRRRWCDMKVCGNRAKARRHYRRKKKGSGA